MIYTAEEIKKIDQEAVRNGLPEIVLMERAASALAGKLKIEADATILVVCGRGNNGGDGWVIARELTHRGHQVYVWAPLGEGKSEAAQTHEAYARKFVQVIDEPFRCDYIIDALFGIGLSGAVTGKGRDIISWIRDQDATIIAVDVPSGVPSDDATHFDRFAVRASQTYSLHGYKRSAFLNKTAPYYGKLELVDIGLANTSSWKVLEERDFDRSLLTRERFSHKTDYGHGQLIGGSRHLLGAPFLAGKAALRAGVGLLDLVIPREAYRLTSILPEAMYYEQGDFSTRAYDAVAIGPGMVEGDLLEQLWKTVRQQNIPLIADAGALSTKRLEAYGPLTLTPHPGEFSRLTGKSVEEIEADRFGVAIDFAKSHHIHLVLKGTYTLIVSPDGSGAVNTVEASALAKGGSGDVLTGILLALWSRRDRESATWNPNEQAVLWHALAAREASRTIHPVSVLASDVIDALGRI